MNRSVHRVSWELTFGPIPAGLHVLHRCDNRACVRPDHLFLGNHADNMADMAAKGRYGEHCGEANGNARLTADVVRAIRRRRDEGVSLRNLAAEFDVAYGTARQVVNRVTWPDA